MLQLLPTSIARHVCQCCVNRYFSSAGRNELLARPKMLRSVKHELHSDVTNGTSYNAQSKINRKWVMLVQKLKSKPGHLKGQKSCCIGVYDWLCSFIFKFARGNEECKNITVNSHPSWLQKFLGGLSPFSQNMPFSKNQPTVYPNQKHTKNSTPSFLR